MLSQTEASPPTRCITDDSTPLLKSLDTLLADSSSASVRAMATSQLHWAAHMRFPGACRGGRSEARYGLR